jgi:hypothetical protein
MRQVILVLLLFASLLAKAQVSLNLSVNIRIACGFVGETSTEVSAIQRLVTSKSYLLLKKKLSDGNKMEAIISAIALKELASKQRLQIGAEEQQRINEIATWQDEYSVCYTCTQHFKGTVSELMKNKSSFVYLLISGTVVREN